MRLIALAAILNAPIMAYPIRQAFCNPVMWFLVLCSFVPAFFIYYGLFSVLPVESLVNSADKE